MIENKHIEYKEKITQGLVEQLGSGIPRILEVYPKESFKFSENFLRVVFSSAEIISHTEQVPPPSFPSSYPPQVEKLLKVLNNELSREQLQERLKLIDRKHFRTDYLQPAIKAGLVAMTIPDKPNSSKQKYYLTEMGIQFVVETHGRDSKRNKL
jgi:ATP-dependent DNA helicase RecG